MIRLAVILAAFMLIAAASICAVAILAIEGVI